MCTHKIGILTIIAVFALGACSSSDNVTDRIEEINEAREEQIAAYEEKEQQRREEELEVAPDWFLSPPDSDATGFFGVGYAKSKNMGHALKSARLQAEFSLSKQYQQELSGSERAFERGDSEGNIVAQTTFLIDKIVDAVPVVGYQVIDQKMVPVRGIYETFVLLKLPYDEFNKVLQDQRKGEINSTVQQAFDDLERRLVKRRAEKERALEAQHQRKLEEMNIRNEILKETNSSNEDNASPEIEDS